MRSASDAARCALLAVSVAASGAQAGDPRVRLLVHDSHLSGVRYYDAAEVWHELRVGHALELSREPDNAHDANAIRVLWRGRPLGYVPRRDNAALAWGLDRGMALRARISGLAAHPNPARRIRFEVIIE